MNSQKTKAENTQKPVLAEEAVHAVVEVRPEPAPSPDASCEKEKKKESEITQDILILENGSIIIN